MSFFLIAAKQLSLASLTLSGNLGIYSFHFKNLGADFIISKTEAVSKMYSDSITNSFLIPKDFIIIFLKSDGGLIQQKLTTSQSNSIQTIQQQSLPTSIGGKTVKIVRLNPSAMSGQSQTLSATIVPSPLKKGVVSIAPKIVKTETLL